MKKLLAVFVLVVLLFAMIAPVSAAPPECDGTAVPGHCEREEGPVTGHYTLDQYGCHYVVNYRGDFGGDPYLDNGWIQNHITCEDGGVYNYLIVHMTDPRYTGENPIWGTWDMVVYVVGGPHALGNVNH